MLTKIKSQHVRKVLWGLLFVIVPAFVLWGGLQYISTRNKGLAGQIEKHRITQQEFNDYLDIARIHYFFLGLFSPEKEAFKDISPQQLQAQAWRFYLLLWKIKQEHITATDEEVVRTIQKIFSLNNQFNKQVYFDLLNRRRIDHRKFEEYIRDSLMIDKLLKEHLTIEVSDEEILNLYKKDNEKAKISYIHIPYEKFAKDISVTEPELAKYYQDNPQQYKEEPKIKIRYIFISHDEYPQIRDTLKDAYRQAETIESLSEAINMPVQTTEYLTIKSPIEGIGWEPEVIKTAFSIPVHKLSPILPTNTGFIVFEKIEQLQASISPFESIKDRVEKDIIINKAKKMAKDFIDNILKESQDKNIQSLETIAKNHKLEVTTTDYFKHLDYIEGIGLNREMSEAIFNAKKGEIIPQSFLLSQGAYIIQIDDIIPIDEEQFKQDKESYRLRIFNQKRFLEELKFIGELEKEFNLIIYATPPQE